MREADVLFSNNRKEVNNVNQLVIIAMQMPKTRFHGFSWYNKTCFFLAKSHKSQCNVGSLLHVYNNKKIKINLFTP